MFKGIDVSQYQNPIDFNAVKKSGVEFVIIRAGYGKFINQKDPCFENHYAKAKAAGLNVGVYWYSYATTVTDARLEARTCLEAIKGKKFEYPIYFDLEERKQFNTGSTNCSNLVKAFCDEIEKAGYFAGLYISRSPLQQYISKEVANKYALWIAEYSNKCNYEGTYGMWQYSSTGKVDGIAGNVDLDYCYVDYPSKIKNGGYNGYEKPKPAPVVTKKVLDTEGFKKGDKGNGVLAMKKLIKIANSKKIITASVDSTGGFGGGTEKAVNQLLKKWGYAQNGIAGKNFINKLYNSIK